MELIDFRGSIPYPAIVTAPPVSGRAASTFASKMKLLVVTIALIGIGTLVWIRLAVPRESAVRVVRTDTGISVVCDGANQKKTLRRLTKLFRSVSPGDKFEILIEPLDGNHTISASKVSATVHPDQDVSLSEDDDVGGITRTPSRGNFGSSGDYIALSLTSEICYPFMSEESKTDAATDIETRFGYDLQPTLPGEHDVGLKGLQP